MCGLSMGGVHANMVASLYPGPVALTPLLAPRSAAGAYCSGALYHATAWQQVWGAACCLIEPRVGCRLGSRGGRQHRPQAHKDS